MSVRSFTYASIPSLLTTLMIYLKLNDIIDISWWIVFLPMTFIGSMVLLIVSIWLFLFILELIALRRRR